MHPLALTDSIANIWAEITDWLSVLIMAVVSVLPETPFQQITIPSAVRDVLGYINYIIPITFIAATTVAWMTAILGYYVIKAALNWTGVTKR